jgi:hypothetical protein
MAITRRPDGLYDIPEANLVGVPEKFIPENLRQAPSSIAAPQAQPDAVPPMLARPPEDDRVPPLLMRPSEAPTPAGPVITESVPQAPVASQIVAPGINDQQQQAHGNGPAAFKGFEQVDASGRPVSQVNPANLHGPDSSGVGTERSPQDAAYHQYLMNLARGTPGTVVRGGPQLAQETWSTHDVTARPGFTPVIMEDPNTGIPVRKMVPNEVLFKAEESKQKEAESDFEAAQQGAETRRAGRELYQGQRLQEAADREAQYVQHLEQQQALNEKRIADHDAQVQKALADIQRQAAQEPPEPSFGKRLTLGLAQGLLYAGAAAAGQQVPHVDWIGQEVQNNIQKQRMELESGLHVAGLKMNALQQLRQQFTSPEAAEHALAAANWAQAQHELEALTHRAGGGQIRDNAQLLWHQLDAKRAEAEKVAYAAEHNQVIANVPTRVVGAKSGGIPGILAGIDRQFKGAPKETIEAAKNKAISEFQAGQPFSFPGGPPAKHDRSTVAYEKEVNGRRIQLHPDFGTGVVYAPTEKEAEEGRASMASYNVLKTLLGKALDIAESVPDRLSPTQRQILKATLMGAQNVYRSGMNMGVYKEAEAPLLETETGADSLLSMATMADRKKVIQGVMQNLRHQAESHLKLSQTTTGPEIGAPFYQTSAQTSARTPE